MIARVTGRLGARGSGVGARESISERGWVVPAAFVLLAAVEGAAVAYVPAVGIGLAAGTFVMAAVVASDQPASRLFLRLLLALLTGYMFLGRGLAHVGVGPAYVGDVVLVAAVLVLVFALARPARFDVLHGLLIVYILLGAALTVPYLGAYGLDALRDGVTWIYALFAIAVSVIVLPAHFERITAWYRRILPLFLLWVPLAYYLDQIGTPALPGSDVSAVVFKGGDKWNAAMKEMVRGGSKAPSDVQIVSAVANDKYGIGFNLMRVVEKEPKVKPLAIAATNAGPFVPPTRETMYRRTYPLSNAVYIYINRPPGTPISPRLKEFLVYILSREGQQDVVDDGMYLPLNPEAAREQREKLK